MRLAHRLSVPLLLVLLAAVLVTAAGAQAPRKDRQPILWRDWTRVAGPDGRTFTASENRRQAALRERWHQVHELLGPQHLSRRGREELTRRGLGPALTDKSLTGATSTWDGQDTLKVLIVRVSFETNWEPGLTTVAPDGDFDLRTLPVRQDTLYVDPPPHDKAYLESHLRGLSEYYRFQSGGRLHIEGQVLPAGREDSYKLTDIADYGPGAGAFWSLENLERFVRDAIVAVDQGTQLDGGPLLADFDDDDPLTYVIIVHAGSDWQSDLENDSPNDIPTFFVTLGEPQALTSTDSDTGAPGALSECSVIPETINQDGNAGSIAAAFYHEFGHALGLPDVYSTATALTQVGIWDLMDSGTNLPAPLGFINDVGDTVVTIATGVLPPSLSAWNKWYLGWLVTEDVDDSPDGHRLPAVGVLRDDYDLYRRGNYGTFDLDDAQAVRGGMSPREWFLMENRWVPGSAAETPYDSTFYLKKDDSPDSTGVILFLASYVDGEEVNTGHYDYFLPAGGLLVWHVNMDRIEQGLLDNTVNYYGDGLRLVEADGIQDVGVLNAYVLGWLGSLLDPFGGYWYDNVSGAIGYNNFRHLYAHGFPNTRCYDRSWSGLSVTGVKNLGQTPSVLTFRAEIEPLLPNFPWRAAAVDSATPRAVDPRSLTSFTVDGVPTVVFADAAPENWEGGPWLTGLYALRTNGSPRFPGPDIDRLGMFQDLTRPEVGFSGGPLAGPPTGWTAPDGLGRLLVGTTAGEVAFFHMPDGRPGDAVLFPAWTAVPGDTLAASPLVLHEDAVPAAVLCAVRPDSLAVLDLADGTPRGDGLDLDAAGLGPAPLAGDLRLAPAATGWDRVFAPTRAGWVGCRLSAADVLELYSVAWPREPSGLVRSAFVPGEAEGLIGFFDEEGLLGVWHLDGRTADAAWDVDEVLVAEPAVADLNGDGRDDVVLATARRVLAYQADGAPVSGWPRPLRDLFPLPDTTRIDGPMVVCDVNGDGGNEVLFGTDGGHLFSLDAGGDLRGRTPLRWGDGRGAGFAVAEAGDPEEGRVMWLAMPGGTTVTPLARQSYNGRVGAFALGPAAPAGTGTSEWRSAAGGSARRGSVGAARHLGTAGPLAVEMERVILYPNPLRDDELTIRFYSASDRPARFAVHDLEGELVTQAEITVTEGAVNEHRLPLVGLASGMYVCRLQWDAASGSSVRTMTLAVEK